MKSILIAAIAVLSFTSCIKTVDGLAQSLNTPAGYTDIRTVSFVSNNSSAAVLNTDGSATLSIKGYQVAGLSYPATPIDYRPGVMRMEGTGYMVAPPVDFNNWNQVGINWTCDVASYFGGDANHAFLMFIVEPATGGQPVVMYENVHLKNSINVNSYAQDFQPRTYNYNYMHYPQKGWTVYWDPYAKEWAAY